MFVAGDLTATAPTSLRSRTASNVRFFKSDNGPGASPRRWRSGAHRRALAGDFDADGALDVTPRTAARPAEGVHSMG